MIVDTEGLSVEVQVRSSLQHVWAELSERLADVVDSTIKYGGGDPKVREILSLTSEHIANLEELEGELSSLTEESMNDPESEWTVFNKALGE